MNAKRSKTPWLRGLLLVTAVVIAGLGWKFYQWNEFEQTQEKYANDPVMLYKTIGIKECGYDTRQKGEHSGAVRLEGDDLARSIAFLEKRFKNITAVLYINAPEASTEHRGQPALLPLRQETGTYCGLGLAGSYSVPLFLELEAKYQSQIQ